MTDTKLIIGLRNTLDEALHAEATDDKAAAVAKTAAIKNIQKALTARILKRLDDGQPLVEVARKMKAIEGMQPQINDMERRLGIMQSVEPVLENAIKTLQKVVDVRGMGKSAALQMMDDVAPEEEKKEEAKEDNKAPKPDKEEEKLPKTETTEPSPEEKAKDIDEKEEALKEEKFGYAANGKVIVDAMEKKHKKIFEDYIERTKPAAPVWHTLYPDFKE